MKTLAFPALHLPALHPARPSDPLPRRRKRPIDPAAETESVAEWARDTAGELLGTAPGHVAESVAAVARAMVDDVRTHGRPPLTICVTVTGSAVEVAVIGGRRIAERTLTQDSPALVEARRLTRNWTTGLGPGGRGSVVTASIPLRQRRRFTWRWRGNR